MAIVFTARCIGYQNRTHTTTTTEKKTIHPKAMKALIGLKQFKTVLIIVLLANATGFGLSCFGEEEKNKQILLQRMFFLFQIKKKQKLIRRKKM